MSPIIVGKEYYNDVLTALQVIFQLYLKLSAQGKEQPLRVPKSKWEVFLDVTDCF